jgi:transposase InsO family protein
MLERTRFVLAHDEGLYSMTELCERFSVSRKTGYKWLDRYKEEGLSGLAERSKAPHTLRHALEEPVRELLLQTRRTHPTWGPRKILAYLGRRHPSLALPVPSTVGDLFKRTGLVPESRRRRKHSGNGHAPALLASAPNQVWMADFKGEFRLGSGPYCYPLTVTDAASRYLLACHRLTSTATGGTIRQFERLFRERGLPQAIRTDNGSPFASRAIGGLSRLNLYWAKLGIRHERIEPGKPQQNGRHERMHRTLKAETARPPQATFEAQQERFDRFRELYNEERPHEALDQKTPSSHYLASTRPLPERLPEPEYAGYFEVRRVRRDGTFKFKGELRFLSETLVGERIALAETDDGIWSLYFHKLLLARFDEQTGTISA